MGTSPFVDKEARLTMANYLKPEGNPSIPVQLTEAEFDEFILEHLPEKTRATTTKMPALKPNPQ